MTDFTIQTAPAPKLTALLGSACFDLATLDLSAAEVVTSGRAVTSAGDGEATKAAADALNQAFGTTAFAEGLTIGIATVAAEAAPPTAAPDLADRGSGGQPYRDTAGLM